MLFSFVLLLSCCSQAAMAFFGRKVKLEGLKSTINSYFICCMPFCVVFGRLSVDVPCGSDNPLVVKGTKQYCGQGRCLMVVGVAILNKRQHIYTALNHSGTLSWHH